MKHGSRNSERARPNKGYPIGKVSIISIKRRRSCFGGFDCEASDLLIPWNYAELRRDSVGAQLVCARSVTMRGVGRTQGAPLRRTLRRRIGQTPVGGHRPPQVNQLSTPAQLFSTTRAHPPGGIRRSETRFLVRFSAASRRFKEFVGRGGWPRDAISSSFRTLI